MPCSIISSFHHFGGLHFLDSFDRRVIALPYRILLRHSRAAAIVFQKRFYWDFCGYMSSFPQKNRIAIRKFSNFLNPRAADLIC